MGGVSVGDISINPSGLHQRPGCLLTIKRRHPHRQTPWTDIACNWDDHTMPLAQCDGDVRILEGRDQHERGVRIDKAIPGTRARDDQSSRSQVVHLLAFAEQGGTDNRQGLIPRRSDDGDDLRRLRHRLEQRGRGAVPTSQQEGRGKDRVSLAGPRLPPPIWSRDIARLSPQQLGDPHVDAGCTLEPRFEIVSVVGTDIGPRAVVVACGPPVVSFTPDTRSHKDEGGGRGVRPLGIIASVLVVRLGLGPWVLARSHLPA